MQGLIENTVAMFAGNPLLLAALTFVAAAAEAVVVVGAVVPGTAILMAVAALAGAQESTLMAGVLAAAILGAIAGDGFAYWLGRRFGRDLAHVWPLSRHPDWLSKGDAYFDRHGGKSVFWGRFIPGVKTVVPVVAGMSRMPVRTFLLANVTSAILWGLGIVLAGLGIGRGLDRYGLADPRLLVLLVALLLGLAIVYWLLRALLLHGVPALAQLRDRTIRWSRRVPGAAPLWPCSCCPTRTAQPSPSSGHRFRGPPSSDFWRCSARSSSMPGSPKRMRSSAMLCSRSGFARSMR